MKFTLNPIKRYGILILVGLLSITTLNSWAQNSSATKVTISKLKAAVEAAPTDLKKHQAFIDTLMKDKEAELDKQYAIWMKKFPKLAAVPFAIGQAYVNESNPKAKQYLLKAVAIDPKLGEAWQSLSRDAERWGDFSKTSEYLGKAVAADPSNADYLFYYAGTFTGTDKEKYKGLSLQLLKQFPHNQRAAQALYWLAYRAATVDEKIKYWEWLRKDYPVNEFSWAKYGMQEYFEALLSIDPAKAEALAVELSNNENKALAVKVGNAKKFLTQNKGEEARAVLNQIKLDKYSLFFPELALLKGEADDMMGKTAAAYDSLKVFFVKAPDVKLKEAIAVYGKKLGKEATQIDADIQKQIDAIAKPATPFTLKNYYTNANTSLSDYKGKVVLLTYWYPDCGPCRAEFPHFENVLRKFKGQDIEYVGINIYSKQNDYVMSFMKQSGCSFTPLEEVKDRAKGTLDNKGYAPGNFLIDRDGRVIFSWFLIHENNESQLEMMIKMLLDQKKG